MESGAGRSPSTSVAIDTRDDTRIGDVFRDVHRPHHHGD
jgi:hypothetical protein